MSSERVFLVFAARCPSGKAFFRRLREIGTGDRGLIPRTAPDLDDDILAAATFDPAIAMAYRDRYRIDGHNVWIENRSGVRLFEREQTEAADVNDSRHPKFVPFTN